MKGEKEQGHWNSVGSMDSCGRLIQEKACAPDDFFSRRVIKIPQDGPGKSAVLCACEGTDRAVKACIANQACKVVASAFGKGGEEGFDYRDIIQRCSYGAARRLMEL